MSFMVSPSRVGHGKNLKVILTDPAGKRVDQRLSGPQEEGGLPVDLYGLVLADGSLVEMVLPCRQHELMVNWSSSEATLPKRFGAAWSGSP